jgi:hypothetical protein
MVSPSPWLPLARWLRVELPSRKRYPPFRITRRTRLRWRRYPENERRAWALGSYSFSKRFRYADKVPNVYDVDVMRPFVLNSAFLLAYAVPALSSELPSRKPGLWEVRTRIENVNAPAQVVRQCIDAATDQMLQSIAGPFNPASCPERNVQSSASSTTIDFKCTVAGKPATAHSFITGSLDDAYTMIVTSQRDEITGGRMTMTMEGKWLGACAADQRPGDIVMSNGVKINVPEIQKRGLSTIPLTPGESR